MKKKKKKITKNYLDRIRAREEFNLMNQDGPIFVSPKIVKMSKEYLDALEEDFGKKRDGN